MNRPTASSKGERGSTAPPNRGVLYLLVAACVAAAAADLFYERHAHFDLERMIAAYGICGFVGSVALGLLASALRRMLSRNPGYYDDR